MAEAANGGVLQ